MSNKDTNNMKEIDMEELDAVSGGVGKSPGSACVNGKFEQAQGKSSERICYNCTHCHIVNGTAFLCDIEHPRKLLAEKS